MPYLKLCSPNGPTYTQVKALEMEDMKETKLGHLTLAFGAAWAVLRFGN